MNGVNKTLYIPLYGKAVVSQKGIILHDPKAEMIWEKEGFKLRGKAKSKWLAYYMGMRCAVFDKWTKEKMQEYPDAVILHLGCGMDSRVERVNGYGHIWYDIDFPEVIEARKKYYKEDKTYHMIKADVRTKDWIKELPAKNEAIIIMEGISMYLQISELKQLLGGLRQHFTNVYILMDCYSEFAARASRHKNPINEVGVSTVCGIDYPSDLEQGTGIRYIKEWNMTPREMIDQLKGYEHVLFKTILAGRFSRRIYQLYEFEGK
ncbi:MAG: class I SAM-dependent methyltransferase [Cellulosilyticum sp.]|nr:class I SAM-dependent methyltransferase [Cellulosilyticum sp.]